MTAPHHDFIDSETRRPWRVRFVRKGDRYGLNHCLTHEEAEPLVEFYDREFAGDTFPDEGQFVSRYYVSTLLKRGGGALNLDDGIEAWSISADGMREAMGHVAVWQAWTIAYT
jgi:hypothetical protein